MVFSALGAVRPVENTVCIVTRAGESGWPLYGPYVDLPAGVFSVEFRIEADAASPHRALKNACGFVDVCKDGGVQILAKREFSVADLHAANGKIKLSFQSDSPGRFEFRVFAAGNVGLTVWNERVLKTESGITIAFDSGELLPFIDNEAYTAFYRKHIGQFQALFRQGVRFARVDQSITADVQGIVLKIEHAEDFHIIYEVFTVNDYNFNIKRPVCMIDIGMNVGMASLYFAKMPCVQEVHAFEPFRTPFDRALANFALNPDLARKIQPYNFGLGGRSEHLDVLYDDAGTIGVSIRGSQHGTAEHVEVRDAADEIGVLVTSAKARGLVVVVKMDCEGSEFPIFETLIARNLLEEIDLFMIEWHKWWSIEKSAEDLIAPLVSRNFIVLNQTDITNPHAGPIYAVRT